MLQNYRKQVTIFYLVEVNITGGEHYANPLAKQWNTNAFMTVSTPDQAHKFQDKQSAIKVAKIQNMLSEALGSTNRVYVCEGVTNNTLYDENGEVTEPESFEPEPKK
ncbi:hypothetical protein [Staphylococcus canis]|uniref:Phage protein n=1 Tax=Staphylococcus canis TaxID=2724942 RepID=A0ABS0TB69_9STAP|nr:hypothetical protein [Staphylococcus canis]MBI5975216.1 hypothetical protein [Staphylococcus canis]